MDFYSPKHLADYLSYLDKNQTAYNSYFKWKKHITFYYGPSLLSTVCRMCIHLQLEEFFGVKQSRIDDIVDYWNGKINCKVPKIKKIAIYET